MRIWSAVTNTKHTPPAVQHYFEVSLALHTTHSHSNFNILGLTNIIQDCQKNVWLWVECQRQGKVCCTTDLQFFLQFFLNCIFGMNGHTHCRTLKHSNSYFKRASSSVLVNIPTSACWWHALIINSFSGRALALYSPCVGMLLHPVHQQLGLILTTTCLFPTRMDSKFSGCTNLVGLSGSFSSSLPTSAVSNLLSATCESGFELEN